MILGFDLSPAYPFLAVIVVIGSLVYLIRLSSGVTGIDQAKEG